MISISQCITYPTLSFGPPSILSVTECCQAPQLCPLQLPAPAPLRVIRLRPESGAGASADSGSQV